MANVTLSQIKKSFGPVDVIHGVSIEIEDGEFVALVGPSGCGKTTLLRMIAGLEDPTTGDIQIGDVVVNDKLPKDRDIAMVFQSYALYPHMSVRENMAFSLQLEKRPQAEIDRIVKEASDILGLGDYLDRRPKALSGGQRQRVAMGRAIVRNPSVFLFDEPLSNLDAKLRTVMRKEVKLLHQRLKTTSIYVTHDQTEAMTMADKIVIMDAGRIEQIGSPLELYHKPANMFVAGFIGAPQMNFLSGRFKRSDNKSCLDYANGTIPIAAQLDLQDGDKLTIGIRPEDVRIDTNSDLEAAVEVVEPMGKETHITCKFGDEELRIISEADSELSAGDSAKFSFNPEKMHFFDGSNGRRI